MLGASNRLRVLRMGSCRQQRRLQWLLKGRAWPVVAKVALLLLLFLRAVLVSSTQGLAALVYVIGSGGSRCSSRSWSLGTDSCCHGSRGSRVVCCVSLQELCGDGQSTSPDGHHGGFLIHCVGGVMFGGLLVNAIPPAAACGCGTVQQLFVCGVCLTQSAV